MSKVRVAFWAERRVREVDGRQRGDGRQIRRPLNALRCGADASQARTGRRCAPRIASVGHDEYSAKRTPDDVHDDDDGLEMFTLRPFTLSRSGDGLHAYVSISPNLAVQRGLILIPARYLPMHTMYPRRFNTSLIHKSSPPAMQDLFIVSVSSTFRHASPPLPPFPLRPHHSRRNG